MHVSVNVTSTRNPVVKLKCFDSKFTFSVMFCFRLLHSGSAGFCAGKIAMHFSLTFFEPCSANMFCKT